MKTILRMAILASGSFLIGLLVNPFLNEGIPWRLLVPTNINRIQQARITYYDAITATRISEEKTTLFIDIRPKADFRLDHIPRATSMPFVEYFRKPARFLLPDQETTVIVYDFEFGSRKARILARYLARKGFAQVGVLYSGFSEWIQSGFPVEKGPVK
jgi:rhodanese-related sulfurtransferase